MHARVGSHNANTEALHDHQTLDPLDIAIMCTYIITFFQSRNVQDCRNSDWLPKKMCDISRML